MHADRPDLTIRLDALIRVPLDVAWRFLASEEGMRRWQDAHRFEPFLGGEALFFLNFSTGSNAPEGAEYRMNGRVTRFEPPQLLAYTWRQENLVSGVAWPEDTLITIRLEAEGEGATRVHVEHSGFEKLPAEYARSAYDGYARGWLRHGSLADLERLLEAAHPSAGH